MGMVSLLGEVSEILLEIVGAFLFITMIEKREAEQLFSVPTGGVILLCGSVGLTENKQ